MKTNRQPAYIVGAMITLGALAASPAFATSDTAAPSVPTGLSGTAASSTQINLSWTASTDNVGVLGYQIFRGGTLLGSTSGTSYADGSLSPSSSYVYTVDAFDNSGNISAQSGSVTVATPATADTTAPSVPTGLSASAASASQINLSWTASTDSVGVARYVVYRNGVQVGLVTGTSYSDTGLNASTAYSYTVAALDAAGNNSGQSGSVSATTSSSSSSDTTAPSVPSNLAASAASASQINLSWNASSDNVGLSGYKVYRNGTQIGTTGGTTFADTGLAASTGYSYTVIAYDAAGNNSAQSSSVSATTLATGSTSTSGSRYVVPPTIQIGENGSVLIHGLVVTSVGTNSFTGTVWGITYTVNYSGLVSGNNFRFLLRNGSPVSGANQIQVGDEIGVQGSVSASQPLVIQASTVRNYSMTAVRQNQNNGNNNYGGNYGNNGNNYGYGTAFNNGTIGHDASSSYSDTLRFIQELRNRLDLLRRR